MKKSAVLLSGLAVVFSVCCCTSSSVARSAAVETMTPMTFVVGDASDSWKYSTDLPGTPSSRANGESWGFPHRLEDDWGSPYTSGCGFRITRGPHVPDRGRLLVEALDESGRPRVAWTAGVFGSFVVHEGVLVNTVYYGELGLDDAAFVVGTDVKTWATLWRRRAPMVDSTDLTLRGVTQHMFLHVGDVGGGEGGLTLRTRALGVLREWRVDVRAGRFELLR